MRVEKKASIKKHNSLIVFIMFFITLVTISAIALNLIPSVFATQSGSLSVSGLDASSTGNASWTLNGTSIDGEVTGTTTSSCGNTTNNSQNGTLTLTNRKSVEADLKFDYEVTLNNGTVKIDGTSRTSNSSFEKTLSSGGAVSIVITSDKGNTKITKVKIFNISLVADTTITGHFIYVSSSFGSYSVNGDTVTEDFEPIEQSSQNSFDLVVYPAADYDFFGWRYSTSLSNIDSASFKSLNSEYSLLTDENFYIKPEFMPKGSPIFDVNNSLYYDLNVANTKASESTKKIILYKDGTLNAGVEYIVSSGNTLLIPCDADASVYTESSSNNYDESTYTKPSKYKSLHLTNGAVLTINGTLNVASRYSIQGQNGLTNGTNGAPSGPYGCIELDSGSLITLNNGAKLYAWGYILGSGIVEAKSGSTVYELFQIRDFRGGSHTLATYQDAFPFNQYYVQNIEAPLKLFKGSAEYAQTGLSASSLFGGIIYYPVTIPFIGSSSGMFRFRSDGIATDYILKKYDGDRDYLVIEAHGKLNFSSISLNVAGSKVNSADYELGLTNNIDFYLKDNSYISITGQKYTLLPGSKIHIDVGSTLNIDSGAALYVFDQDEYKGKTYSGGDANRDIVPIMFAPGKTATRNVQPTDAEIEVNGTIYVNGGLFTSAGGAKIYSSTLKPGKIYYTFSSGKETVANVTSGTTIQQSKGTSKSTEGVTFYLASLTNGDGSFVSIRDYYLEPPLESYRNNENIFEYGSTSASWDGDVSSGTQYKLKFVDSRYSSFVVEYPKDGVSSNKKFTFPTKDELLDYIEEYYKDDPSYNANAFKDGDNEIIAWDYSGVFYKAGEETSTAIGDKTMNFVAFWEGWITNDSNGLRYSKKNTEIEFNYAKGMYRTKTYDQSHPDTVNTFKFTDTGYLDTSYNGTFFFDSSAYTDDGDDKWYYFENGVAIETIGLIKDSSGDIYCVSGDISLYANTISYISSSMIHDIEGISEGYYQFDENAKLVLNEQGESGLHPEIGENGELVVGDNSGSYTFAPTTTPHGLYSIYTAEKTYLYYVKKDRYVVSDCTFYVTADMVNGYQINGTTISAGLYYFDSAGHMYDSSMNEIVVSGQLTGKNFVMGAS